MEISFWKPLYIYAYTVIWGIFWGASCTTKCVQSIPFTHALSLSVSDLTEQILFEGSGLTQTVHILGTFVTYLLCKTPFLINFEKICFLNFPFLNCPHNYINFSFSRTFAKLRKATIIFVMSVRLSVRPHGTTRHPLDGFSWNLIFECFSKIDREKLRVIKIRQN
jgi:hypothetical protein